MAENSYTSGEMIGLGGTAEARRAGMPSFGNGQKITVTATTATNSVALGQGHVMIHATNPCFIRLAVNGSGTAVVDTDMYIAANTPYMIKIGKTAANVAYTHICAIRVSADGVLYIMPMLAD